MIFVLCACTPQSGNVIAPVGDIQPPSIIGASQKGPRAFEICFDEDVTAVRDTYRFQPEPTIPEASAAGSVIEVSLSPAVKPGVDCTLSGEAQDLAGTVTRFLFSFAGYNETPAILRINELQCGKNTSASNPHRDYIELAVTVAG
ncbi:MAG: hypothetical protein LLF89_11085, partial [Spirochaetaceae bacterium]|nr:hypothetical protein [Spirochaetaceae bacterium]